MVEQALHLLHSELHGEELVEKAKSSRRTSAIACHPWLHMVHLVVNLVDNFMVSLQSVKLLEVVRREDIHAQDLLQ